MKDKDKTFLYIKTIDLDLAGLYSKSSCKLCRGRGYLKFITASKEEHYSYCKCSEKNMKKYR